MSAAVRRSAAAVALVAALVCVQAASGLAADPEGSRGPGRELAKTGFAYLYGVRAYAAAMLWSGIEPVYHKYYSTEKLADQVQLIPTIRMVQLLDPQFEQPYYIAAWMIARRGDVRQGLEIARTGVEENPDSGLLRASYAQLLLTQAHDVAAAREQADMAVGSPYTKWATEADRYEGYALFAAVYDSAGEPVRAAALRAELDRMRAEHSPEELSGDHD